MFATTSVGRAAFVADQVAAGWVLAAAAGQTFDRAAVALAVAGSGSAVAAGPGCSADWLVETWISLLQV